MSNAVLLFLEVALCGFLNKPQNSIPIVKGPNMMVRAVHRVSMGTSRISPDEENTRES